MASSSFLLLLQIAALATLAAGKSLGELPTSRHLMRLVDLVRDGKVPSVEDVVAGYREYIELYRIQSRLANEAEAGAGDQLTNETRYEQIGRILRTDELKLIASTLFEALSETDPEGQIVITEKLRRRIEQEISSLQSGWAPKWAMS